MKTIAIIGEPTYFGYSEELRHYCFEKNLLPDCNIINTIDDKIPVQSHWETIKDAFGLIAIIPWSTWEFDATPDRIYSAQWDYVGDLFAGDEHGFMVKTLIPADIDKYIHSVNLGRSDEHGEPIPKLPLIGYAGEDLYIASYHVKFPTLSPDLRKAIGANMRIFPVFAYQTEFYAPRVESVLDFSNFLELEGRIWLQ